MNIGKLRNLIVFERPVETRNELAETVVSWLEFSKAWASIEPLAGREFFQAQQINSETTHKITIRYLRGLTTKHRARFGKRIFDINNVANIEERNIEMQLLCKERN